MVSRIAGLINSVNHVSSNNNPPKVILRGITQQLFSTGFMLYWLHANYYCLMPKMRSNCNKCTPERFPVTGPLEAYDDYDQFLSTSKNKFVEEWSKDEACYLVNITDFEPLKIIGVGNFGQVFLVKRKGTDEEHAAKVIVKCKIVDENRVNHVENEMRFLKSTNSPQTLYLNFYYITNDHMYLLTPHIPGGSLFDHLKVEKQFDENTSMFFVAQVVLGLEYLHYMDILYRDIKPENILIDLTGYLKLSDFGLCKLVKERTYTMCGTPEYLAPEVITSRGHGKACDWWGVGILTYELNVGKTPFRHSDTLHMYGNILSGHLKTPHHFSAPLRHLVTDLLQVRPTMRLGNLRHGTADVKQHQWFRPISWTALFNRKMTPPYLPAKRMAEVAKSKGDLHKDIYFQV